MTAIPEKSWIKRIADINSFRTRLILLIMLLVVVIMGGMTYFNTFGEMRSRTQAAEAQINRIARNIATVQLLDRQDWAVYQNYISRLMAFNPDIVFIAVYDDRQALRAHTLNLELIEPDRPLTSRREQAEAINLLDRGIVNEESRNDLRIERVNIQLGSRVLGSVHVGFSIIEINREIIGKIRLNILIGVLLIVVFTGIAVMMGRKLSRPLEELSGAMALINEGDYRQRVTVHRNDEIGRLARSFNDMSEGLYERKIIESLGYELSAQFQLEALALLVRDRLNTAIGADGTRMYLRGKNDKLLFHEVTIGGNHVEEYPPIRIDSDIQQFLLSKEEGFMIRSAPIYIMAALHHSTSQDDGLALPMAIKGELFGLLFFAARQGKMFSRRQRHFAAILARQAVMALENAILYEGLREQERLSRELEIAREVQTKLLPREMPEIQGYHIEGYCRTAFEVGGDYFDFFTLDEDHLGVVVADVCGKGTSASFYMAELKGMMLQVTSERHSPAAVLEKLNRQLRKNMDRNSFITMLYGVLEISSGRFCFARAGHNELVRITADANISLHTPQGIGLGLDEGPIFTEKLAEESVELLPGEKLLLYTDGLTEAMNNSSEQFGEDRLYDLCRKGGDAPALRADIDKELRTFCGETRIHDDFTVVIIQRKD
jgi:serine phosphatase RsbU (regulator of sigma subunit)/HAMP domain-containing protein